MQWSKTMSKPPVVQNPIKSLLEQYTRCEIMARIVAGDEKCWAHEMVKTMDQLRQQVFGTSDLVELGRKWKMVK